MVNQVQLSLEWMNAVVIVVVVVVEERVLMTPLIV